MLLLHIFNLEIQQAGNNNFHDDTIKVLCVALMRAHQALVVPKFEAILNMNLLVPPLQVCVHVEQA
jgi:hypothetical protein